VAIVVLMLTVKELVLTDGTVLEPLGAVVADVVDDDEQPAAARPMTAATTKPTRRQRRNAPLLLLPSLIPHTPFA
jgi:hypothetical protein